VTEVAGERFRDWMAALGAAWEARDPDAAAALFAEGVHYHETPFDPPLVGLDAVRAYWAEVPEGQRDVRFGFEVLATTPHGGLARWWASFERIPANGARRELDGVVLVELDGGGRCTLLREWWHGRDVPLGQAG
jgi:hypothetical protein